ELVQTHRVDDALYDAAEAAFGQEGVVDMVNLVGAYLAASALTNAFQVGAPLTGDGGVGDLMLEADFGSEIGDGGAAGGDADDMFVGFDDGTDGGAGGLGGRLPLIDGDDADPAQAALAAKLHALVSGLGAGTGIEFLSPDGQLIGPFNAFLYNPAIGSALLGFDSA